MGITGLLPLLKHITSCVNLSQYRGKKVAVDGYSWLHKSVSCCAYELVTNQPTNKWMKYCLHLIDQLLEYGIVVYMVFDGANLPAKADTEKERAAIRKQVSNNIFLY